MTAVEVDYRKPPKTETDRALEKVALVIGTAMPNRFGHPSDRFRFYRFLPDKVKLAANAAHCFTQVGS
jgi:hypothetical protein